MVSLRASEVFELREKIDTVTDEVEAMHVKLQTVSGLVLEATKLRKDAVELRETLV